MNLEIKKDLVSNWFKTLQDALCDDICKLEKNNSQFKSTTWKKNIKKEIIDAKKTFQKYKWPSIDVTRKSVEETAASIIKIHEIYLNNVK